MRSAFDEIANEVPTVDHNDSTVIDFTNSDRFYNALISVGELVRTAGHQKPKQFIRLLRQACLDDVCRDTVLQLSGEEAQIVIDAIQAVWSCPLYLRDVQADYNDQTLDELQLNYDFYRHALYLLVKLSANTNSLPTSLFVHGVDIGKTRDPTNTGGFADIYRGRYEGFEVAVKKLRFFDEQRDTIHKVLSTMSLGPID